MILVIPLLLLSSLWAFSFGKKLFPYHNLPMLFSAQETGILGIPLDSIGLKAVIIETVNFISQPVSATMLFCVGYNFSISKGNQKTITKIALIHFGVFAIFGLIMQGILFLIGNVNPLTRCRIPL